MAYGLQRSTTSMAVRSALWIVVAIVFLVQAGLRMQRDHQSGRPVAAWVFAQIVLWLAVFCFWTWAAIRDWKRRNDQQKVL